MTVYEAYDDGQGISIDAKFDGGVLMLGEYAQGKHLGTITATLQNGKLVGTWTSADGERTEEFEAGWGMGL